MKISNCYLMSRSNLFMLICVIGFFMSSCVNERKNSTDNQTSSIDNLFKDSLLIDSTSLKIAGSDSILVIAGESIGQFQLTQDIEQSAIFNVLGEADSSDAAMCKSWTMWYLEGRSLLKEFDVYSVCDPAIDMRKSIQILRLAHVGFNTLNDISNESSLEQVKQVFPKAEVLECLESNSSELITLIDNVSSGIAFEIADDKIMAVIVHKKGERLLDTYLPFYKCTVKDRVL